MGDDKRVLFKEAMGRGDDAAAAEWGTVALRCFTTVADWPEGMVFVPPGEVEIGRNRIPVEGFLIDRNHVTLREWLAFDRDAKWRGEEAAGLSTTVLNSPVVNITCYDAMGYAAWARKAIPTEAQWIRAAQASPDIMVGAIDEWTQTTGDGYNGIDRFGFGVPVAVRFAEVGETDDEQGEALSVNVKGYTARYEEARGEIGFRCVRELVPNG